MKMIQRITKGITNALKLAVGIKPTPGVEAPKPPFQRQAEDLTRYIYRNPGLNNNERRSLEAKIRLKKLKGSALALAKWQLRNTPINVPATHQALKENSEARRLGKPLAMYSRRNRYADKPTDTIAIQGA